MSRATKSDILKKQLIEALEKSLGVITTACHSVGIARSTFYEWYNADPEFKNAVDNMEELALDMAESSLHKQVQKGIPASTIFYLKTKGRKRGYTEHLHVKTEEVLTKEERTLRIQELKKKLEG